MNAALRAGALTLTDVLVTVSDSLTDEKGDCKRKRSRCTGRLASRSFARPYSFSLGQLSNGLTTPIQFQIRHGVPVL